MGRMLHVHVQKDQWHETQVVEGEKEKTNMPSGNYRCQSHTVVLIVELLLVVFTSAQQRWPRVQAFFLFFFFFLRPCVNVRTRVHMMCSRG